MKTFFKTFGLIFFFPLFVFAQKQVKIYDTVPQHIFTYNKVYVLEDSSNTLSLAQILNAKNKTLFKPSVASTPQNLHLKSTYWYRISIAGEKDSNKNWILEFFDQTIDDLVVYVPDSNNNYIAQAAGEEKVFSNRSFAHKNFEFRLQEESKDQLI
ncbi:MAG: chromosome partitioning protein ParA, partial [Pedobacter sp.]|nr:chromosome partitioning protein ParA [Pedobacter sp.]